MEVEAPEGRKHQVVPLFEIRYNTAKIFLELKEHRAAVHILKDLVAEDDSIGEIWHTLAIGYECAKKYRAAHYSVEMALKVLQKAEDMDMEENQDLLKQILQLKDKLKPLVGERADGDNELNDNVVMTD